jgi:hypothetical protein
LLDPAEELAAAKASPDGAWLSPAAQELYEREGAARFVEHHPAARFNRPYTPEFTMPRKDEHPAADALRWAGFGPEDNAAGVKGPEHG